MNFDDIAWGAYTWRAVFTMAGRWMAGHSMADIAAELALPVEDVERCLRMAVGRV